MEYEIVKAYRKDDKLRGSFNRLAVKTFGLNLKIGIRTDIGERATFLIQYL